MKNRHKNMAYAIMESDNDVCESEEYSTGFYFKEKSEAINSLKEGVDVVVKTIDDLTNYDFNQLSEKRISVFVEDDEYAFGRSTLYEDISLDELKQRGGRALIYEHYMFCSDDPVEVINR